MAKMKVKYVGSNYSYTVGKVILRVNEHVIIELDSGLAKSLIANGDFIEIEDSENEKSKGK